MRYVLNQKNELRHFLKDARVPIHNNASESALRIVALLRKNALFVGHEGGGRHLAILLSLCATCRLHDVNPEEWMADAFIRVTERGSTVEELLPWNWKVGRGAKNRVPDKAAA
jgi:transposase